MVLIRTQCNSSTHSVLKSHSTLTTILVINPCRRNMGYYFSGYGHNPPLRLGLGFVLGLGLGLVLRLWVWLGSSYHESEWGEFLGFYMGGDYVRLCQKTHGGIFPGGINYVLHSVFRLCVSGWLTVYGQDNCHSCYWILMKLGGYIGLV